MWYAFHNSLFWYALTNFFRSFISTREMVNACRRHEHIHEKLDASRRLWTLTESMFFQYGTLYGQGASVRTPDSVPSSISDHFASVARHFLPLAICSAACFSRAAWQRELQFLSLFGYSWERKFLCHNRAGIVATPFVLSKSASRKSLLLRTSRL